MKTISLLSLISPLLFAACAGVSAGPATYYTVDGYTYCALHKEKLVGLRLPIRYGYQFGFPDPLKKKNHPNYMPWSNGGDLFHENDPKDGIFPVCLSCKQAYEELHPKKTSITSHHAQLRELKAGVRFLQAPAD